MRVTLYSKPECHLCDELKADLIELQRKLAAQSGIGFSIQERNIEENADDFERYRYLIPVLDIENGPIFYPPINLYELEQALRSVDGT